MGYGSHFLPGDRLEARDASGHWGSARVTEVADRSLRIHFRGWGTSHDDWIPVGSGRLKPTEESRSQHGQAAVGRRLQVQWDEDVWYSGTVASFNPATQRRRMVRRIVLAAAGLAADGSRRPRPPACMTARFSRPARSRPTELGALGPAVPPSRRHAPRSPLGALSEPSRRPAKAARSSFHCVGRRRKRRLAAGAGRWPEPFLGSYCKGCWSGC